MMSRKLIGGTSLALVLLSALLFSGPSVAQEVKVGFVNVAMVLDKSPQAAEARAAIEKEFAPRDRELLAKQKKLRAQEDQLVRDQAVMTQEQQVKLETGIRALRREIRRVQEEFRADLNLRRNEALGKLQRKVIQVIQELAKAEKFDLVIGDGILFASERVDITNKVIAELKNLK